MTRYQVLLADPLLAHKPQWPEGCALVEELERGGAGTHWWSFEDPGAPSEMEGRQVDLKLRRGEDGSPQVASRRLIVTHLVPQDDSGEMPCCGVPAWEKPGADGFTGDKELVTCGGAP